MNVLVMVFCHSDLHFEGRYYEFVRGEFIRDIDPDVPGKVDCPRLDDAIRKHLVKRGSRRADEPQCTRIELVVDNNSEDVCVTHMLGPRDAILEADLNGLRASAIEYLAYSIVEAPEAPDQRVPDLELYIDLQYHY
jgi:hypothetical protein